MSSWRGGCADAERLWRASVRSQLVLDDVGPRNLQRCLQHMIGNLDSVVYILGQDAMLHHGSVQSPSSPMGQVSVSVSVISRMCVLKAKNLQDLHLLLAQKAKTSHIWPE